MSEKMTEKEIELLETRYKNAILFANENKENKDYARAIYEYGRAEVLESFLREQEGHNETEVAVNCENFISEVKDLWNNSNEDAFNRRMAFHPKGKSI